VLIDNVFKTLDPLLKNWLNLTDQDPLAYYDKLESAERVDHIPPLRDLPENTAEIRVVQAREALLRKTIYFRVLRLVYVLTALLIPIVGIKLLVY